MLGKTKVLVYNVIKRLTKYTYTCITSLLQNCGEEDYGEDAARDGEPSGRSSPWITGTYPPI